MATKKLKISLSLSPQVKKALENLRVSKNLSGLICHFIENKEIKVHENTILTLSGKEKEEIYIRIDRKKYPNAYAILNTDPLTRKLIILEVIKSFTSTTMPEDLTPSSEIKETPPAKDNEGIDILSIFNGG